jgi:hypothetical protein
MQRVRTPVNWSAVACQAFEATLDDLDARKPDARKSGDLDATIERLRGSKPEADGARRRAGVAAGENWARHKAEAAQLKRLERLRARLGDWNAYFIETDVYSVAEHVGFVILDARDLEAAASFWKGAAQKSTGLHAEFVQGFVEGALGIWDAVKSRL